MRRRRHPRFFDTKEGRAAADAYDKDLTQEALNEQHRALAEALFDPRHAALKKARAADESVDIVAGWDREAVLAIMQMRSAEKASAAITRATWALVAATTALAIATGVLIHVTGRL